MFTRPAVVLVPLALFATAAAGQDTPAPSSAPAVVWEHDLAPALARAKADKKPALVFFTASWCGPCKQMKEQVCSTPEFAAAFASHVCVLVDIDQDKAGAKSWQVGPIPDVRFVDASGEELGGFVGSRSLAGMLQVRDAALQSGHRADELRAAVAKEPQARALLALGEHLLARPNKSPGVEALRRAIAADPDDEARVAARAHWLITGAQFQALGRASAEDRADAEARLARLAAFRARDGADVYADACRAWLQWTDAMAAWSKQREQTKNREQPLRVPADAPLCTLLARLVAIAEKPGNPAADAAADALLIDGLLHYYSGELDIGLARLTAFTRDYPAHRWHGEGDRFIGVVQRLQQKAAEKK